jgi:hypothetical protein
METFNAELWAMWIAPKETAKGGERLHTQGVQKIVIICDSQPAVQ